MPLQSAFLSLFSLRLAPATVEETFEPLPNSLGRGAVSPQRYYDRATTVAGMAVL